MNLHEWQSVVSDGSVRVLKYSFGVGTANTLAAKLDDGSWLVMSPACKAPDAALEALGKDGPVSALVAPNAFHHMGQAAWRARFPNAVSYAPDGALARLAKKSAGVPYKPLSELSAKLSDRVKVFVPQGMKADDALASVGTKDGAVWFGGDLISNTVAADIAFVPRMIFKMLGGGTGYRFNSVPAMVYLKDKATWKADVKRSVAQSPLAVMVPAHGEPVRDGVAEKTAAILS